MSNELAIERDHRRKGTRVSFIIHALIILIAFFTTCNYEKTAEKQYAVAINFEEIIPPKLEEMKEASNSNKGAEAEGKAREKADKPAEIKDQQTKTIENKRPDVKLPKVVPTPPTPTDPVISETTVEDETDVTAAEEEIEFDELEPQKIPDPIEAEVPAEEDPAPEPAKESVKDKIGKILDVFKSGGSDDQGNPKGDPSRSDGSKDGTGEGSKGTGAGADESGNDGDSGSGTGGAGKGQYDGTGNGIFGRKVIKRNIKGVLNAGFENQTNKKIVAKVCIDRSGKVSYAEIVESETTAEMDSRKLKAVLNGIYGYEYEPKRNAPKQECGKLTITLTNINAIR